MLVRSVVSLAGALFGATMLCACGGDELSSEEFVEEYCEALSRCCQDASIPFEAAKCRGLFALLTSSAEYDGAAASECIEQLRTTNCSSDSSSTESACDKVYVNEPDQAGAAVGAACDWDDDCAASPEGRVECVTRFDEATNGWVGLCQVQIPGKEGASARSPTRYRHVCAPARGHSTASRRAASVRAAARWARRAVTPTPSRAWRPHTVTSRALAPRAPRSAKAAAMRAA